MAPSEPVKISVRSSPLALILASDNSAAKQFQRQDHDCNDENSSSQSTIDSLRSTMFAGPSRARHEQEALRLIKSNAEHHTSSGKRNSNIITNNHNKLTTSTSSDFKCHQTGAKSGSKQEQTRHRCQRANTNNYQSMGDACNRVQPEAAIGDKQRKFESLCPVWRASSLLSVSARPLKSQAIVMNCLAGALVFAAAMLLATAGNTGPMQAVAAAAAPGTATSASAVTQEADGQQQQQLAAATKAVLESELEALLQQHHESQDTNGKLLSEAIISRLMLGNLSNPSGPASDATSLGDLMALGEPDGSQAADEFSSSDSSDAASLGPDQVIGPAESAKLRKLLNYLHNYGLSQAAASEGTGLSSGQVFDQFPVLPASQAATAKRASQKVGSYLRQQQQHSQPRQLNGYGRSTFDFGLGKRPDASVAGGILRLGDSGAPGSGQFGKRPSAHRYDFGLGKRVTNPTYPRYDFGLGKRAPTGRIRYDFGLGK